LHPEGAHHGTIEVMLVAYDREEKPLNFVVTKAKYHCNPRNTPAHNGEACRFTRRSTCPRNTYTCALASTT
jgi:hypothetical protein